MPRGNPKGVGNPLWVKGKSPNPGGRPKQVLDVIQLARKHTPEAIGRLVEIMRDGQSEAACVSAAVAILDRGWGKPVQSHEIGGPGGGPVKSITRIEIVPVWPNVTDQTSGAKTIDHIPDGEADVG